MDPHESFQKAEEFFKNSDYDKAADIYIMLRQCTEFEPFCNYRLAAISNNTGDPLTAYDLYYRAFSKKNDLVSFIYPDDPSNNTYVFNGLNEEMELTSCPLCNNTDVHPKWCYPLTEAHGYNDIFNPVRLWMYCELCHHMYARYFPEKLFFYDDKPRTPSSKFFSYYSNIFNRISQYTPSMTSLFEVGIGACECLLVAQEMGYDAFGIDVIEKHVLMAREKFGLNAQTADFVEFKSEKKFDVIIMGDVIEHVSDPVLAMHNAYKLLNEDGAIWVSTPNFDSAFSVATAHADPMRREPYHLNYFSRISFFLLLDKCGFTPVDYCVSAHYNGSMEIIAVKSSRLEN